MKVGVTAENINGKQCTVIRKPFNAEWTKEQLGIGIPVLVETYHDGIEPCMSLDKEGWLYRDNGDFIAKPDDPSLAVITILPALPIHPRRKDIPLLYAYMSEGIRPYAFAISKRGKPLGSWCGDGVLAAIKASRDMEIVSAHSMSNDYKIMVAIEGDDK